jgi:glutathione S-transferase
LKKAVLTLYFRSNCPYSLRVRLCLAEKQLAFVRRRVHEGSDVPDELAGISGGRLPALLDDSFAMYDAGIICEYLDEIFPKPPLRLIEPRGRALLRMATLRIDQDLTAPLHAIAGHGGCFPRAAWSAVRASDDDGARADGDPREAFDTALARWDEAIGDSGHLFGMQFSVVDAWLFSTLEWARMHDIHPPRKLGRLNHWYDRIRMRPSAEMEVFGSRESDPGETTAGALR